jgi:hypothetical protein
MFADNKFVHHDRLLLKKYLFYAERNSDRFAHRQFDQCDARVTRPGV